LTKAELADPRVSIEYLDGRFFIKKTPHRYDIVLVGISNPSTLQINRLFSKEFFSLVKRRLEKGGILVMALPGSLTYLSKELGDLNACILNTLKGVYPYVRVIPGDFNLFLASASKGHIEYKLDHRWADWFFTSLKGTTEKINQDFSPLGMFYSLAYWNSLFSPHMKWLFRWFEQVNLRLLIIPLAIFPVLFLIICFKGPTIYTKLSIPFAIMASGFAGMIFDLALIYTFQALYGYVFHQIDRLAVFPFFRAIFLVLSFFSGLLIGAQFPLANKIYLKRFPDLSGTAGLLYGADLAGGWIGGLLGGVVLLPVLGLVKTCTAVVLLKMTSLLILLVSALLNKGRA
jgi:spermidine synthase